MLRGAKHILKKKNVQKSVNNNGNAFRKLSQKKTTNLKGFGNNVTIEETSLIVKRCVEQIRLRGLNTVNIFKPMRIGDGGDEVKYLLNCLLNDNLPEFEDEIQSQDINNIVSAMKWALRHCKCIIIPFNDYEHFNLYEQEMNYDVRKRLFTNYFLNSIPILNREIVLELFDICIQLTSSVLPPSNSDIDNNPLKIIKSLALCLIGYNDDEKEKNFNSFDDAYREWIKSSNACLHLFLAYVRELVIEFELPPYLTLLLDNYVELRKEYIDHFQLNQQNDEEKDDDGDDDDDENVEEEEDNEDSEAGHEHQKEVIQTTEFPESPTKSNKSRKCFLKKSLVHFSAPTERPISILRVTRTVPPSIINNGRKSRCPSILLPEMLDNLNRRTIVRTSAMMSLEEQNIAEKIWIEFQRNGIASLSDDYIKLFFSLDERMIKENLHNDLAITPIEKNWKDFSKKGFKSFYLEPPLPPKKSNDKNNLNQSNKNVNDIEKAGGNDPDNAMRPKTIAWDDFTTKGFRDSLDNLSDVLTLASSVKSPLLRDNDHNSVQNGSTMTPTTTTTRNDGKKHKLKRGINLRALRKKSFDSNNDSDYNEHEEDWEDWYVIDAAQDFQVTTHLAIETIDELFPYIWIETTADEVTNRWGEWVFVEPRQDLINRECEWIMIEEKEQILNIWDDSKVRGGRGKLRRKSNAFSTFSLPWVRTKSNNINNKRDDKIDSKLTRSSSLPRLSGSFDNSDVEGHNTRRKRISTKDISAPIPIDYTEEISRRLTSQGYDSETGMMEMGYTNENNNNNRLTQTSHIMPTQYETVAEYDEDHENYAEGYGGERYSDEYAEENDYDEYDETADRNSMGEFYYDENTDYIEHLEQDDDTRNEHTEEGYNDDDYTTNTQYGYL